MVEKRIPTAADFDPAVVLTITPPPNGQPPTNILILLHGLGDTHVPFTHLGRQLSLPNTACIAIRAPTPLPFEATSFHWCDDVIFDSSSNGLDPDGGFESSTPLLLNEIIKKGLIEKCGYKSREIIFFGLGQGGIAALDVALHIEGELGGVVSIAGPLPAQASASSSPQKKTPVLVCSGVDSPWITSSAEEKLKRNFEHAFFSRYRRKGDNMPQNRDEMLPIMQFFARRLRQPAPRGTVEVA